jgi:hypothetical protein
MMRRKLSVIPVSFLLIATLAGPAYGVVGEVYANFTDGKGNPLRDLSVTWGVPVKTSWSMSIQDSWNKSKDPEVISASEPSWSSELTAPKLWHAVNAAQWTASLLGVEGFARRMSETESMDFLYFLYRIETRDPYCRFYNMVDDQNAGLIKTDEFYEVSRRMSRQYDYDGPWNYPGSYVRPHSFGEFISTSLHDPPFYLSKGMLTAVDHVNYDTVRIRTGEDGSTSALENPVQRTYLFADYGAYTLAKRYPILEFKSSFTYTQPISDKLVVGYDLPLKGLNSFGDYMKGEYNFQETSRWNIGVNYQLSAGYNHGSSDWFNSKLGLRPEFSYQLDSTWSAKITPNDPFYASSGTWSQSYGDQWALQRIGFKPLEDPTSAWRVTTGTERPVVVAVIDSGIDLTHPDLHIDNIWKNARETAGDGLDNDNNGYIDDLIGWNFVQNNNNPFDLAGHGTHVAGIIAARWNNGQGIAGINRGARIMVLKALNEIGKGWGSDIARAIVYAVDNGAKIINISAGNEGQTKFLEKAFAYAQDKGVLIVVSAGNEAIDTAKTEPANQPGTLVVAATLPNDKRVGFSNFGQRVNLAAPGVDVLSLRAHGTDIVRKVATDPGKAKPGEAAVGDGEKQYYRASGTSFSAPLVSGVASLMLAKNPALTAEQIKRMLMMSADDIETPGWDQLTRYGCLNAR